MKLYKYRSLETKYDRNGKVVIDGLERCIDIIENHRLYFPTREELNDPYEGMAKPISIGVCGAGNFSSLGMNHPLIEDWMNEYRILSLSNTPLSMQMWAHYTNNYNGVCFEFSDTGILGNARSVKYIKKPYQCIYDPEDDVIEKTIYNNLFCKSFYWKYENEYRIVKKTNNKYIEYNADELTGIIIGINVDERTRNIIINKANENEIPIYYTIFTPKEYKLTIGICDAKKEIGKYSLEDIKYK